MFYICSMTGLHIIWFRQDLRVHDNAALRAACQCAERDGGEVAALYILPTGTDLGEPDANAETRFLFEALRDLQAALAQRGAVLHLRQGDVTSILSDVHRTHQVMSLHLHDISDEDADLRGPEKWCLRAGIPFREHRQFNPQQAPGDSELWQTSWERFMARPRHEAPDMICTANIGVGKWPRVPSGPMGNTNDQAAPRGGRKHAIQTLRSCLGAGAAGSHAALSSVEAIDALKPHLQIGAVSTREVWQAAAGAHQQALKAGLDIRAASMASFLQLLPTLFRPRAAMASAKASSRRASKAAEHVATGQQLSLGFEESGRSTR